MRRRNSDADPALAICDDMRHLLSERAARYEDAPPDKRDQFHRIDTVAFGAWSDLASRKRKEYVDGKLTAQEFLRAIDTYHVLSSYDVPRPTAARKSEWRRKVESNLDFDPTKEYPSSLFIDLGKPDPQWEFTSSEEHRLEAQEGHRRIWSFSRLTKNLMENGCIASPITRRKRCPTGMRSLSLLGNHDGNRRRSLRCRGGR